MRGTAGGPLVTRLPLFLSCLVALGCSAPGGSKSKPVSESLKAATGGVVESSDGRFTVRFDEGALANDVKVSISVASAPPAGALTKVYRVTLAPDDVEFTSARLTFEPEPGRLDTASLRIGRIRRADKASG